MAVWAYWFLALFFFIFTIPALIIRALAHFYGNANTSSVAKRNMTIVVAIVAGIGIVGSIVINSKIEPGVHASQALVTAPPVTISRLDSEIVKWNDKGKWNDALANYDKDFIQARQDGSYPGMLQACQRMRSRELSVAVAATDGVPAELRDTVIDVLAKFKVMADLCIRGINTNSIATINLGIKSEQQATDGYNALNDRVNAAIDAYNAAR